MNWPFLTFTARPVRRGGDQEVGLPAEEGRDLEHVAHLGRGLALRRLVDVGEDRQPGRRRAPRRGSAGPRRSPGPRKLSIELRFALSNEDLKTSGKPEPRARSPASAARGLERALLATR